MFQERQLYFVKRGRQFRTSRGTWASSCHGTGAHIWVGRVAADRAATRLGGKVKLVVKTAGCKVLFA